MVYSVIKSDPLKNEAIETMPSCDMMGPSRTETMPSCDMMGLSRT